MEVDHYILSFCDAVTYWFFYNLRWIFKLAPFLVIFVVYPTGMYLLITLHLCSKKLITDSLLFKRHKFSDFVKPASSKGMSIDEIHLTEDEKQMYLDLAPFLNPCPYIVPEDMSLSKVNMLFIIK